MDNDFSIDEYLDRKFALLNFEMDALYFGLTCSFVMIAFLAYKLYKRA